MVQIRLPFFKFSLARFRKLAPIAAIAIGLTVVQAPQVLLASGIPQRWEARQYQPPKGMGRPKRVEAGGTRSIRGNCVTADKPLTALVPSSSFGVTAAAYPSFFVYVPARASQASMLPVEFVLADAEGNEVYKATFKTSGNPGIVTVNLPNQAGFLPLQVGQDYKWSFSVICQEDDRSGDITVEGWTRRIELNPTLKSQLMPASPERQAELYAEAEIWQDALATLVQLRREKPNDLSVTAKWTQLLSAVGLEAMTREAPVSGSTTPQGQLTLTQP